MATIEDGQEMDTRQGPVAEVAAAENSTGKRGLPLAVYILALGTFCLGTSEFMLAGLLPDMARELAVSPQSVGLLITGFAVAMAAGAPVVALATLGMAPRRILLSAVLIFAVAHLIPFVFDGYAAVMASRIVAGVACATYWALAAVVAIKLAGPGKAAKAMAAVVGGLTLANVIGVPLGTAIGDAWGWRAAFLALALVTVLVFILLRAQVPSLESASSGASKVAVARVELTAFRQPSLWAALLTTTLFQASIVAFYTYLAPLLTQRAGVPDSLVWLVLLGFGLGSFVGVVIGGRYGDRNMLLNITLSIAAIGVSYALIAALSTSAVGISVAVGVLGISAFSIAAALNGRVLGIAVAAPTLAAAVNVTAFNVGNAVGPWLGGRFLARFGELGPLWAGALLIALAATVVAVSWWLQGRTEAGGRPPHRAGFRRAGFRRAGFRRAGFRRAGSRRAGSRRAGSRRAGSRPARASRSAADARAAKAASFLDAARGQGWIRVEDTCNDESELWLRLAARQVRREQELGLDPRADAA